MLNAPLLQVERLSAQRFDPRLRFGLLIERRLMAALSEALMRRHFGCQLAIDLLDLVVDLHHGRIARLERSRASPDTR